MSVRNKLELTTTQIIMLSFLAAIFVVYDCSNLSFSLTLIVA